MTVYRSETVPTSATTHPAGTPQSALLSAASRGVRAVTSPFAGFPLLFFPSCEKASCYCYESNGGCNFLARHRGATERGGKSPSTRKKMKMSGKLCKSLANTDFISHVYMTINIYKERKIAGKTGAVWENQHPDDEVELIFSFFFSGRENN